MTVPINPVYAQLAYRKAMISQCVDHLSQFASVMKDSPRKMISEDLVVAQATVPQTSVDNFLVELKQQAADVALEMSKFEFVKKEDHESKPRPPPAPSSKKASSKKTSKKASSKRRPPKQ